MRERHPTCSREGVADVTVEKGVTTTPKRGRVSERVTVCVCV